MAPVVAILPPAPAPYREPLFRLLAERGVVSPRVVYLAAGAAGWDQQPAWYGAAGAADVLRARQLPRPGRSPVMLPRGVGATLRRIGPDCVVSWEYGPSTLRALAWCRRHRRPLLLFSELTPWSDGELSAVQRRVHRTLVPRVDGFLVASSRGAERLHAMGVAPERIEVALQSANVDALAALATTPRPQPPPVRLLAVGRLVPDKNLELLIDALAEARLEPGRTELELVGSGPLEGELRRRAERLRVPLRITGPVAPTELADVYGRAHALALVSVYEPFGVTMREGAAAGLPLICSRRAGAAGDVAVEGENALLVDPGSRSEIAAALRRIVLEPALRERLAAGSRAVTERHPPAAGAEAWERAVARVTGG